MEDTQQLDPISAAVREMVGSAPETTAEAPVEEVKTEVEQPQEQPQQTQTEETPSEPETVVISFGEEVEQEAKVSTEMQEIIAQRDTALAKLQEKETANVFANEQLRKLNDYVLNGGKIDKTFWDLQEKDYTKVDFSNDQSMMSVLKDKLTLIDGLTEREAERVIKKQYPTLSDPDFKSSVDEDDILDEMLALKTAIRGELPKLQELQGRAALPKEDVEAQRKNQEALRLYQAEADKALSGITSFKLQLSDEFSIQIAKDKETEKYLRNLILYPENQSRFFVDNYAGNEKPDFQRLAEDEFFRRHRERIIKTAYNQGLSAGTKSAVQRELRQENPQGPKEKQSTGNSIGDVAMKIKSQLNPQKN